MKNNKKFLIALAIYKEAENIKKLIMKIRLFAKKETILIINDYSGDNTKQIINKIRDPNIVLIEREKKLGLGTAHKLSMFYAIKKKFDYLITMDGDFSHDPSYIPLLIKNAGINNFVIGSRFIEGSKSDYTGLRKIISICGNYCAKKILNISLNEITTYFRVYSVKLLKKLPFNELNAEGYSLGVKVVWLMKKINAKLIEIPIHFKDRNKGKSKIPKFQIFVSFFDLILIFIRNIFKKQKFYKHNKTYILNKKCSSCKKTYFSLKLGNYKCLVCNKKL